MIKACRSQLLDRIEATKVGLAPFRHLFIEDVFPEAFYAELEAYMLACKRSGDTQARLQDNPEFVNQRFNLLDSQHPVAVTLRDLLSDPDIKRALLAQFFVTPDDTLVRNLTIHKEFEFFFTKAGRFQNIHIDIPPKFLSFVFYVPEFEFEDEEDQRRNATILYDQALEPHYKARFKRNSVCVFSPHFHSYHGFDSTRDRDVLVAFYVHAGELQAWRMGNRAGPEVPPFDAVLGQIERKLATYPLLEFDPDPDALRRERLACRVNAPNGRVIVNPVK